MTFNPLPQSIFLGNAQRGFISAVPPCRKSNKLLHLLNQLWQFFRVKQRFALRSIRSFNFSVWLQDFLSVNGFEETSQDWGREDADLVFQPNHFGILRKNGCTATQVFHLWHQENKLDRESSDKNRVIKRMQTDQVQADRGLREIDPDSPVKITQLSS